MTAAPRYSELQVATNFSFLRGASHAHELVLTAQLLGHPAIGIADRNTLAGVVRAHRAAREVNEELEATDKAIRILPGARLDFTDAPSVLCYPTDRAAYGRLSRLLTRGKRISEKGECRIGLADLLEFSDGQILIALTENAGDDILRPHLALLREAAGDRLYLAAQQLLGPDDRRELERLATLAAQTGVPLVATNDVHYHDAGRRPLQDVLSCIREGCTIHELGRRAFPNAERVLKSAAEMARLFGAHPDAVDRTGEIVQRCTFSLDELRYEYPAEPVPAGHDPQTYLEQLTWEGAKERYNGIVPVKVRDILKAELKLIGELQYAPYFLTVRDIVAKARELGILVQGRGSAANSAVCYVTGITNVDPDKVDLLVERFISAERGEPPDIDVDFEHERREEIIQYIYSKYGRDRAALAATVISYRSKMAVREVGKAMGLSVDTVDTLSKSVWGWSEVGVAESHAAEAGLDPTDPVMAQVLSLTRELIGFPRHLSQHVGGFVISRGRLDELVPIENAAMEDRTVIEWDKDDLEELGLLKIDVLALGMLTCLRKAFDMLSSLEGRPFRWEDVPLDDPVTYDMLCRADSLGVFQVESRAQMTMLPRLRPRTWYDLVIEVAIVRPGPIQGDMVHPYLLRRKWKEQGREIDYPSAELRGVLEKTLGVPLFQEQAMKIAIVGAGFTPGESDKLRRAMATFKHTGNIARFRDKFVEGMVARNYDRDFAERCFRQIEGFGNYGFPESHAASFAHLVYVSAWIKCHHPAVFCAALLNSQPMGFYAPAQIVRDAKEHGVEVRPADINRSEWDCTLEDTGRRHPAVRLGLRQIRGIGEVHAVELAQRRAEQGLYRDIQDLRARARLPVGVIERLARGDAFASLGLDRRQAFWDVRNLRDGAMPLFDWAIPRPGSNQPPADPGAEPPVTLPALPLGEAVIEDYRATGLSLKRHPAGLLRDRLAAKGFVQAAALPGVANGRRAAVAGIVLVRQRPGTASGVIFATLEDETGVANIVIWPSQFERHRRIVLRSALLGVRGQLQKSEEGVIHLIADRLEDHTELLGELSEIDGTPDLPGRPPAAAGAIPGGRNFH